MMASMEFSAQESDKRTRPPRKTRARSRRASCYFARPWLFLSIHDIGKPVGGRVKQRSRRAARVTTERYVPRPTFQADGGETGIRPVPLLRCADQHQDQ